MSEIIDVTPLKAFFGADQVTKCPLTIYQQRDNGYKIWHLNDAFFRKIGSILSK